MKIITLLAVAFFSFNVSAQVLDVQELKIQELDVMDFDTLTISGKYKGKNLFVKNPFAGIEGSAFSVQKIILDNKNVKTPFNQSAFMINLSERDRQIGQDLDLMIIYLKGKKPVILNADVIK